LPVAVFTASPTSGVAPLTVQFSDASTGAKTWAWDFQNDDSFESTEQNPTYTYTQPGTYTVRLQVENDLGGDEEIKTDYITVTAPPPPGSSVTLLPVADAKVRSSTPDRNYGTTTDLQVRLENPSTPHTFRSYLKFAVSGLAGPVTSAKLRLYVTDPTKDVGSLYTVSNLWSETGITWTNAPLIGGNPLASVRAVTANTWLDIDLGSAISGNGEYSFALKEGTVSDSAFFSSREGANKPQLVLTVGAAS
jgi:PKD repeat protein